MGSEGSDLLIFSERGYSSTEVKESKKTKAESKTTQQGVKPAQSVQQPQQNAQPAKKDEQQVQPAQDVRKLFCTNHPWRQAYGICDRCKLPYCYVDLIEFNKKYYCLQDIDYATRQQEKEAEQPVLNNFSVISSLLFVANSALLIYFTYQQIFFLTSSAEKHVSGIIGFFLNLNPQYYIPLANTLIILFGFVAALTALKRSLYGFAFSFTFAFASLFVLAYEYLNSSVTYLLVSSIILLASISFITFSRMSSISQISEEKYAAIPPIEWPKPESF